MDSTNCDSSQHDETTRKKPKHMCSVCPGRRRYKDKWGLTAHNKRVHQQRRPCQCTFCDRTFFDSTGLAIHIRVKHTGEKPFWCSQCGRAKSFTSQAKLDLHLKSHSNLKPHSCPYCDKSFLHRSHLTNHVPLHTGEKPYVCQSCGKRFSRMNSLKSHVLVHTGEKPFACSFCAYKCKTSSRLQDHVRSHTGEKLFKCDACGNSFTCNKSLQLHIASQHDQANERVRHTCTHCGKTYSDEPYLKKHISSKHLGPSPQIMCNVCRQLFDSKEILREHKKSHHVEREFRCCLCEWTFPKQAALKMHIATHTGEKPFRCGICGKVFTNFGNLKRHKDSHRTDRIKMFVCRWCSKSFFANAELTKHSRECKQSPEYKKTVADRVARNRETGEHRFFCETCGKPYSSSNKLKRHRLELHGIDYPGRREKIFSCKNCGKSYAFKARLEIHIRKSTECNKKSNEKMISVIGETKTEYRLYELHVVLPELSLYS